MDNVIPQEIHAMIEAACNDGDAIESMEKIMLQHDQVDIPPTEEFKNGMYIRRITIPKGTLLTGRVHKYDYVDIMLSGDIVVATPNGVVRLVGHNVCDGRAGRKRAGYAFEDTDWITVHRVDQNCDDMIEQLTFFSKGEYSTWSDRQDYVRFLLETGLTPQIVRQQSENLSDQCSIELQDYNILLRDSPRDGLGLYSTVDRLENELIAPARMNGLRTQAGRYTNHSLTPNALMSWNRQDNKVDIDLLTIKKIPAGSEITIDYRQALGLREARESL